MPDPVIPVESVEQKVERLEKELNLGVSRTGEPIIPPVIFKWVALSISILIAIFGTLTAIYPTIPAFAVILALLVSVASVLGIASPGIRKQIVLAFGVFVLAGSTASCSAAPVRREVCVAFISCENALDPQNPVYTNTYGDNSACWTDHRQGIACVEACEAGIASLTAAGISCPVLTPSTKEVK